MSLKTKAAATLFAISAPFVLAASCEQTTKSFFINGVLKPDYEQVAGQATFLNNVLQSKMGPSASEVTPLYNPSEGFFGDMKELATQFVSQKKIAESDAFLQVGLAALGHPSTLSTSDQDIVRAQIAYKIAQSTLNYTYTYKGVTKTTAQLVNDFADTVATELKIGNKVVLIAHSQGNMFANDVFTATRANLTVDQSNGLGVVNVATPAAWTPSGYYITIKQDTVINTMAWVKAQLNGSPSPMPFNADAPDSIYADSTAHGFTEVYLSAVVKAIEDGISLADHVVSLIMSAINATPKPPPPLECRPVAAVCPDTFSQAQFSQVLPGLTIPQANGLFGCTGSPQAGTTWLVWNNGKSMLDPLLSEIAVSFTNGVYVAGNGKSFVSP